MASTRVGIVILGDEVLKSEIREANLAYMIPLLNEWGAKVVLCAILPDEIPTVVRHLRAYKAETDLLILTGGIGPTPDDITRDAVAQVAGVPVVLDPEAKAMLEARYPSKGESNPYRMLMAHVPEGAELIPNPVSAAPGFFIDGMAAFPGVPVILHGMFEWVRSRISGTRQSRVTLYSDAPESKYAGIMKEMMDAYPDTGIGSYPMMEGSYRVRIVFRADRFERAAACADAFTAALEKIGYAILSRSEEPVC
jgi:molybdenum cofactor synthesis domain-containing protein